MSIVAATSALSRQLIKPHMVLCLAHLVWVGFGHGSGAWCECSFTVKYCSHIKVLLIFSNHVREWSIVSIDGCDWRLDNEPRPIAWATPNLSSTEMDRTSGRMAYGAWHVHRHGSIIFFFLNVLSPLLLFEHSRLKTAISRAVWRCYGTIYMQDFYNSIN